ncbi:unnamed protein product [Prunus armeniaca]|uniref:Uncharacterized protein n=1 Tax=Prunus armeniaca TaxID=36596 RepID=A0A6J5UVJ9_PRUAR|nr:unnamed protein product [Prunus armeniaca]
MEMIFSLSRFDYGGTRWIGCYSSYLGLDVVRAGSVSMSFEPARSQYRSSRLGLNITVVCSSRNNGLTLRYVVLGDVVPVNMVFIDMVLIDMVMGPGQNGTRESRVNLGSRWG